MPGYTRIWADVNNLQGTRMAAEIDDASRETHLDLTERFSDIVVDVNADPWVLKGLPAGTVDYDLPHSAGIKSPNVTWVGTILEAVNFDSATADGIIQFPILAPRGSRLRRFSMNGRKQDAAATLFMTLNEINADTNVGSAVASLEIDDGDVSPDIQGVVSEPVDFVLQAGRFYSFAVDVRGRPFNGAASLVGINYTIQLPG